MSADLPHTLYRKKGKAQEDEIAELERLAAEAAERKRKARENGGYTVDDVFDGIADE